MTELTITPVTHANFRDVIAVQVAPGQEGYIEPNSQSLAEVHYDPELNWHPYALMRDATCVGFAMTGAYETRSDHIWLDRFMIGADFQHQGLGGQFLEQMVALIHRNWPGRTIYLSYHKENRFARRFYLDHGFTDTGRVDPSNGELMMTRH